MDRVPSRRELREFAGGSNVKGAFRAATYDRVDGLPALWIKGLYFSAISID